MISPGFIQTLLKNNLQYLNWGNKYHMIAIPNCRKLLKRTCRNTDRSFTGKLSIVPGKNIMNLLNDGGRVEGKDCSRGCLKCGLKNMRKILRGPGKKRLEF